MQEATRTTHPAIIVAATAVTDTTAGKRLPSLRM